MPYSAAIPPYPTHERQREIPQQAKDQVEQDRQAAIRASLIRAGQNVGSRPQDSKARRVSPAPRFQETRKRNREEEKQAGPQAKWQGQAASPQRLPQPSRLSTAGNDNGPNLRQRRELTRQQISPQAACDRNPSSEGAKECSPQPALSEAEGRKPSVTRQREETSPIGAKENTPARNCIGPSAQKPRLRMTKQEARWRKKGKR